MDIKKITSTGPGLVLGIPTLGRPVTLSWAMMLKSLNPPINYNTNTIIVYGKPVDEARNEIVQNALDLNAKYVFFIGDDTEPPLNCLKQLIFRMEQDSTIGVCGAIYCAKSDPPAPLVFRGNGQGSYWDWKVGEFFEVTGLGMDATIIRVDAIRKMSKPWFKTLDEDSFADAKNKADQWTEDLYFCHKLLNETDYKIYAEGSLICKHWDVYNNKFYTLPSDGSPMRRLAITKEKKALDIGCGPIDRSDQFPEYTLVRTDIREECNPDYRCDVTSLPFNNEEFDLVFSSHVLEHFGRGKWQTVLAEWLRVLKPEGELVLCLPNIEWAMKAHLENTGSRSDIMNVFYGAQSNPYDFHYNGFTPGELKSYLKSVGVSVDKVEHQGYNMILRGTKDGLLV